jgi:hypothetical protein
MGKFFMSLLLVENKVSSKRFVTLMAFIFMAIGFISDLFFEYTVNEFIYEYMAWIVLGGLGFTASEQFSSRRTKKDTTQNENIENI